LDRPTPGKPIGGCWGKKGGPQQQKRAQGGKGKLRSGRGFTNKRGPKGGPPPQKKTLCVGGKKGAKKRRGGGGKKKKKKRLFKG